MSLTMPAKRQDVSVKINPDVYRLVKTVAAWKGISIAEYLSQIAEPAARRDFQRMQKEGNKEDGA